MRAPKPSSFATLVLSAFVAAALSLAPLGTAQAAKPNASQPQAHATPAQAKALLFVEWHGSWWAAQELHRTKDGQTFIHYVDWGSEWDEPVEPARLKRRANGQGLLFVEWHGSWWPASVLGTERDGRVRVHYDGWGKEWDELVEPARLLRLG